MTDTLSQFEWSVAEDGYEWIRDPEGRDGWFLKWPNLDLKESRIHRTWKARFYAPMQESGLFLRFAAIKPNRDGIQEFANRYGLLARGDLFELPGEPLDFWVSSIRRLSHANSLWEMAKQADVRGLARFISWQGKGVDYKSGNLGFGSRWIAVKDDALFDRFRPGDLIGPAWYQLQYIVNEQLASHVSPRLLWGSGHTRLGLHYVPVDLISALWLQLARAIDGDRKFNQCEECRNWFEIASPDGGRSDKKYCGSACRARAWRKERGAAK